MPRRRRNQMQVVDPRKYGGGIFGDIGNVMHGIATFPGQVITGALGHGKKRKQGKGIFGDIGNIMHGIATLPGQVVSGALGHGKKRKPTTRKRKPGPKKGGNLFSAKNIANALRTGLDAYDNKGKPGNYGKNRGAITNLLEKAVNKGVSKAIDKVNKKTGKAKKRRKTGGTSVRTIGLRF